MKKGYAMSPMIMILMVLLGFGILALIWAKVTGGSGTIASLFAGVWML